MPFDPSKVGVIRAGNFTAAGGSLDWSAVGEFGSFYIRNLGPNIVYIATDAIPANTLGDGRISVQVNEAHNIEDTGFQTIGVRAVAAGNANVEAWGFQRPGGNSGVTQ
jgi:hypothetical protein